MDIDELERKITEIRSKPLPLVCRTPSGKTRSLTIRECWASGARYLYVDCTEIDTILGAALGGDNEQI